MAGLFCVFVSALQVLKRGLHGCGTKSLCVILLALLGTFVRIHGTTVLWIIRCLEYAAVCLILLRWISQTWTELRQRKPDRWTIPFSLFFAVVLVFAESYSQQGDWSMVSSEAPVMVLKTIGYGVSLWLLLQAMDRWELTPPECPEIERRFFRRLGLLTGLMLLLWLPGMLAQLPAGINIDTRDELAQITGNYEYCLTLRAVTDDTSVLWSNHHPVLYTAWLAIFVWLGRLIGNYNVALAIAAILQTAALAFVLAYTVQVIVKKTGNVLCGAGAFLFFGLNPMLPLWGMTLQKDVPNAMIVLLLLLQGAKLFCGREKAGKRDWIGFFLLLLLSMVLRRTGLYVAAFMLVLACVFLWKNKRLLRNTALALICAMLAYTVGVQGLYRQLGIPEGSTGGALNVPLQQTIRCVRDYPEDVTPEEEQVILKVLGGGEYTLDELVDAYVPLRADNIIFKYNKNADTEDLKAYLKVWVNMGLRHPDSYVQGFLAMVWPWFENGSNHDRLYYDGVMCDEVDQVLPGVQKSETGLMNSLVQLEVNLLGQLPGSMPLVSNGVLTWFWLILMGRLLMKKRFSLFLCCAPLMGAFLINLLGPVAYIRYMLPAYISLPVLICFVFCATDKEEMVYG